MRKMRKSIGIALAISGFALVVTFQNCLNSSDSRNGSATETVFKTLTEAFLDSQNIKNGSVLIPSNGVPNEYFCENDLAKVIDGDHYYTREIDCSDYRKLLNFLNANNLTITKEFLLKDAYGSTSGVVTNNKKLHALSFKGENITDFDFSKVPTKLLYLTSNLTDPESEQGEINLALPDQLNAISLHGNNISKINIASWPTSLEALWLTQNKFTEFNTSLLPESLKRFTIGTRADRVSINRFTQFDFSTLPPTLEEFTIAGCNVGNLDSSKLPRSLKLLSITDCPISSISEKDLPSNLEILTINKNAMQSSEFKLTSINTADLPRSIKEMNFDWNNLESFDVAGLPSTMKKIRISYSGIESINISALPASLEVLDLNGNKIHDFTTESLPAGLVSLTLSRNGLQTFSVGSLPATLRGLSLQINELTSFNNSQLDSTQIPNVGNFYIYENHICEQELPSVCKEFYCDQICDE